MSAPQDVLALESRVPAVLAGTILPTIIGSIFVLARLYTRTFLTKNWGPDDSLITISWLVSIALAIEDCLFTRYGTGHHAFLQTIPDIIATMKLAFSSRILYQFILCTTKSSICLFYLRVFYDKTSKICIYSILAFTVVTFLAIELAFVFACTPVSGAWTLGEQNCLKPQPSFWANTICNVLADIALMIFVVPRLAPLKMPMRQKMILVGIVSLGFLVIIAAIVRLHRILRFNTTDDFAWNGYDITTWTSIEINTGLVCACAPCIRPLLRQIAPRLLGSLKTGTRTHRDGDSRHMQRSFGSKRAAEAIELGSNEGTGEVGAMWKKDGKIRRHNERELTLETSEPSSKGSVP